MDLTREQIAERLWLIAWGTTDRNPIWWGRVLAMSDEVLRIMQEAKLDPSLTPALPKTAHRIA